MEEISRIPITQNSVNQGSARIPPSVCGFGEGLGWGLLGLGVCSQGCRVLVVTLGFLGKGCRVLYNLGLRGLGCRVIILSCLIYKMQDLAKFVYRISLLL